MATSTIAGDLLVQGSVRAQTLTPSSGSVTNASVSGTAAIDASKLCHRIARGHAQTGTASSATIPIHVAGAAGTVTRVSLASIVIAIGAATVTADLKKNGTTVLGGVVTIDSTSTARTAVAGAITVPAYVAGDFFELIITASAGGGTLPTGLIAEVAFDENPS